MNSLTLEKLNKNHFLVIISILILILTGAFTLNSRLIWILNPPGSHLNYAHENFTSDVNSPTYPFSPIWEINSTYLQSDSSVYSPHDVNIYKFSVIGNGIPGIPKYSNGTDVKSTVLSVNIGFYFYIFKIVDTGHKPLIQSYNKTYTLNAVSNNFNSAISWESYNNILISGQSTETLTYEYAITITLLVNDTSTHFFSIIYVAGSSISYSRNSTNQINLFQSGLPSPADYTFKYIFWGIYGESIIFIILMCIVVILPITPKIKSKLIKK